MAGKEATGAKTRAARKRPVELTEHQLDGAAGGGETLNNKYPENMKHEVREHVSFTYQKITH